MRCVRHTNGRSRGRASNAARTAAKRRASPPLSGWQARAKARKAERSSRSPAAALMPNTAYGLRPALAIVQSARSGVHFQLQSRLNRAAQIQVTP